MKRARHDRTERASIPLVEEQVRITPRPERVGGVEIDIGVETRSEPLEAELTREHVEVTRVRVDQEVEEAPPTQWWDGDTLVLPIVEEKLVVVRRLFVREEIRVRKRVETEHHTESVQSRSEVARVRRIAPEPSTPHSERNELMKVIIGTFDDVASARVAEQRLKAANFDRIDVVDSAQRLTGYGLPTTALDRHRADVSAGRCLVVVRCDPAREAECRRILEGGSVGQGIGTTGATAGHRGLGATGQRDIGRGETLGQDRLAQETTKIPIVEEQVNVGKVAERRGGVQLHTYVEERDVEQVVNLREEHVEVERHKVDRPVGPGDAAFQERTVRVDEVTERPVVEKTARVVEEVEIRKDVVTRPETIHETVRRTDVDIDDHVQDIKPMGMDAGWRHHFDSTYRTGGDKYETYEPAYRFGHDLGGESRFQSSDWNTVESEARTRWGRSNDISTWEKMKNAVRHAFESRRSDTRRPRI